MSLETMLLQSSELMLLGMLTVFTILVFMIGLIHLTSRFTGTHEITDNTDAESHNLLLVAVIQAAIHRYRLQQESLRQPTTGSQGLNDHG